MVAYMRGNVEPYIPVYAQLIFSTLAIPLRFYSTIAGEREKRSWELLRVAPVTNTQLVLGKFAAMAYMALLIHAIFFLPYLFSIIEYGRLDTSIYYGFGRPLNESHTSFFSLATAELYSFLTALFVAAITVFFSARSKRSYTALALSLGAMGILFIFVPLFTSMLVRNINFVQFMSPFSAMGYLARGRWYGDEENIGMMAVYASMACMFFLTVVFLLYAANTLAFADNLVKFIPKKRQDARS
jgi:ABC-type transport system involved in multi-copper enzyme maturation permease subunit